MTSISEKAGWDDIYQIKRSDRVEGGRNGVANAQAEQLAGRTLYLKQQFESFTGLLESGEMPYASEDEVIAQIQAGKINDGDVFSVRSANPLYWVEEFTCVGGVPVARGKYLPSSIAFEPVVKLGDNDPDGTITGLSITTAGQFFRVTIQNDEYIAWKLYRNTGSGAELWAEVINKAYADLSLQYTDDLLGYLSIDISQLTGANYINPVDGSLVNNPNWKNSTYFPVKASQKIKLTAVCNTDGQANIAFYDKDKTFISAARTGATNTLETARFTVPQDGFIILCTRTATSEVFGCTVTDLPLTDNSIGTRYGVAGTATAMALADKKEAILPVVGATREGALASGFIDNSGAVVESVRKYRALSMSEGETAFYFGYARSSLTTLDQIQAAVFVAESGAVEIVEGLPRTLSASCWYSGRFTATQAGTLFINLEEDPNGGEAPYGYLLGGLLNDTILHSPAKLLASDVDAVVVSKILHERDMSAIKAGGAAVDVTAGAETLLNKVLYNNGAYQDLSRASSAGQWCTRLVPVREGDVIRYYGVFNESPVSVITYLSQLDEHKNYVAELLARDSNLGYQTVEVTATHDGFIAIRVRLINTDGSPLTHTISRIAPAAFDASALLEEKMDTQDGVTSTATAMAIAAGEESVQTVPGATGESTLVSGYIDNAGAMVGSARKHRALTMKAGETAFYSGFSRSSQTTIDQISAVIFVDESGTAEIVKGLPRTLAGSCWYSGQYVAPENGTLYINLESDPKNAALPYGSLRGGTPNETILHSPAKLLASDVGTVVISKALHERDMEVIAANGAAVNVTDSAEVLREKVLYSNGAYQDLSLSTAVGQWCTKLVAVRKGDRLRYYGVFNESSGSVLSYLSQLDTEKNYVAELLASAPTPGYQTVEVTATQDGYIAVRVRLINTNGSTLTHTISRIGPKYFEGGGDPIVITASGALCTPSMDKLPVKLDATWLYNSPSYQQNGIVTAGDYQYVACIAQGRLPHILQRSIFGGPWSVFDLSTIPGNPFASPNAADGHNSFSIAVTKDGHILVTGNEHVNECRCVISASPHDISAWNILSYTDDKVTYPRFIQYPDGTTQVFWRQGTSGNGTYYMNTFDDSTLLFGSKALVISAPDGGNPYEQTICVDNKGVLHLCWGYRVTSASADSNSGLYYAKSADKGQTFTNATGDISYAVPLHSGNSERPVVVNQGSGYVNQNGACVDLSGNYHTVYWQQDENGYTQITHLWFNGLAWKTETVSNFTYTEVTSGSLLNGTSSRPQIVCTRYGKIYVIYRTTEDGLDGQIRAIDVTTPGKPVDYLLTRFNANRTELSVNVWEVLQTGTLSMMLYNGVNRVAANLEGKYLAENAWLFQAQLP